MEVVMASAILGLVMTSLLSTVTWCCSYVGDMRRWSGSSQALQEKMESIRLVDWTQLQGLSNTTFSATNDIGDVYSGTIAESPYDTSGTNTTVMKITLMVTWMNRGVRAMTNSLTTLVASGGLNQYISQ